MNEQQQRGRNNKRRGKAVERSIRARLLDFFGRFIELPEDPEGLDEIVYRHKDNGKPVSDLETFSLEDEAWRMDGPDGPGGVDTSYLPMEAAVIEIKSRQTPPPQWFLKAVSQAEEAAEKTGKRPYIVASYLEDGRRVVYVTRKFDWIEKEYE